MKTIDLNEAQKYCVFESNDHWFGFSSLNIRGVIPAPEISGLPHSDPVVVGVAHVQNEFLPVINLRALLDVEYENKNPQQQMMILSINQLNWGLLIDKAHGLSTLEVSISTLPDRDDTWSKVVTGSASWSNQVLQVLDPEAVYGYAHEMLQRYWRDAARFEFESTLS